jgi:hypothetical protein
LYRVRDILHTLCPLDSQYFLLLDLCCTSFNFIVFRKSESDCFSMKHVDLLHRSSRAHGTFSALHGLSALARFMASVLGRRCWCRPLASAGSRHAALATTSPIGPSVVTGMLAPPRPSPGCACRRADLREHRRRQPARAPPHQEQKDEHPSWHQRAKLPHCLLNN